MNNQEGFISFCDFPEKFRIETLDKLYISYNFDTFTIRNVLWYTNYIGIEPNKQRLFSIIFMRQMPQYVLGEGSIEFDLVTNRLTAYISGHKPIPLAQIE